LDGFIEKWDGFIHDLVVSENFPGWRRMWDDFILEEIKKSVRGGNKSGGGGEEENAALAVKDKKRRKIKKGYVEESRAIRINAILLSLITICEVF